MFIQIFKFFGPPWSSLCTREAQPSMNTKARAWSRASNSDGPHAVAACRVCRNWCSRQAQPLFWHFCTVLTLLRNFNSLTLHISASVTVSNALTHAKYLLVTHSNFTGNHFLCTGVTLQLSDTPLNYLTQNLILSGNEFLNVCWHISIIWQLSVTYLTLPTNYLTPPSIYRGTIYFLCNRSAIL